MFHLVCPSGTITSTLTMCRYKEVKTKKERKEGRKKEKERKKEVFESFILTFCATSTKNHMHVRREVPSAIITKVRVIVLGGLICRF